MAGGKKITVYLDISSFYSYLAFKRILEDKEALLSHGVEIEFKPFFLGGVNHGSGNKPPWTLPAKAKYSAYETERAKIYFGATFLNKPDPFPVNSLWAMRSMAYIVATQGQDAFEQVYAAVFRAVWQDNVNPATPEGLMGALGRVLSPENAQEAARMGQQDAWKGALRANTDEALQRGAYGAPWTWAEDGHGREEPFFGSDRFAHLWQFLGLPWEDMKLKARM